MTISVARRILNSQNADEKCRSRIAMNEMTAESPYGRTESDFPVSSMDTLILNSRLLEWTDIATYAGYRKLPLNRTKASSM